MGKLDWETVVLETVYAVCCGGVTWIECATNTYSVLPTSHWKMVKWLASLESVMGRKDTDSLNNWLKMDKKEGKGGKSTHTEADFYSPHCTLRCATPGNCCVNFPKHNTYWWIWNGFAINIDWLWCRPVKRYRGLRFVLFSSIHWMVWKL